MTRRIEKKFALIAMVLILSAFFPCASGAAPKPWLGVEVSTGQVRGTGTQTGLLDRVTVFLGGTGSDGSGIVVVHVYSAGPAQKAGMKTKDVIVELNGAPVNDQAGFAKSISMLPVGAKVTVTVARDGTRMPLYVTLEPLPKYMTVAAGAKEYYDDRRFDRAEREYTMAINLKPDEPAFYFYRGYSRYRLDKLDAALTDLNRSLNLNPDPAAYALRGLVRAEKDQPEAALDDYNRSLSIDPGQDWVYRERSVVWEMKGNLDNALFDIDNAIEHCRKNDAFLSDLYLERSKILCGLRRVDDAIEDIDRAVRTDPGNPEAHGFRGYLLIIKGDYRQALVDLNKAIELNKKLFSAYESRSRAHEALGHVNEALADMKKALSLRPDDPGARRQVKRLTERALEKK